LRVRSPPRVVGDAVSNLSLVAAHGYGNILDSLDEFCLHSKLSGVVVLNGGLEVVCELVADGLIGLADGINGSVELGGEGLLLGGGHRIPVGGAAGGSDAGLHGGGVIVTHELVLQVSIDAGGGGGLVASVSNSNGVEEVNLEVSPWAPGLSHADPLVGSVGGVSVDDIIPGLGGVFGSVGLGFSSVVGPGVHDRVDLGLVVVNGWDCDVGGDID